MEILTNEDFAREVANYMTSVHKLKISTGEIEALARGLGYQDGKNFATYLTTPEGKDFMETLTNQWLAHEIASYMASVRRIQISPEEVKAVSRGLGYEDIQRFNRYLKTKEGKDYAARQIRLEMWEARREER